MTGRGMLRLLTTTTVAGALAIGLLAVPAGASAPTKTSAADCEAVLGLGDEVPDTATSTNYDPKTASALAEGFDATADKVDSKKLKKSLLVLSDVYSDIGKAKNEAGALAVTVKAGKRFAKALKVWSKSTVQCALSNITLPSDITLPSGITLPK